MRKSQKKGNKFLKNENVVKEWKVQLCISCLQAWRYNQTIKSSSSASKFSCERLKTFPLKLSFFSYPLTSSFSLFFWCSCPIFHSVSNLHIVLPSPGPFSQHYSKIQASSLLLWGHGSVSFLLIGSLLLLWLSAFLVLGFPISKLSLKLSAVDHYLSYDYHSLD